MSSFFMIHNETAFLFQNNILKYANVFVIIKIRKIGGRNGIYNSNDNC